MTAASSGTALAEAVVGRGVETGTLGPDEVRGIAREGLARLPVDGRRVLVLIPDGTRTMPMPMLFEVIDEALGRRATALDFLVALGTHAPMDDARLSRLVGRTVAGGRAGARRVVNHRWDDPASFATLGTIPASEIEELTGGRLRRDVAVALNRMPLDYDHVLVCGPVFPHEVVGFSGGTKYLFPGIAGPEIIHFTHWLGALITNFEVIGTKATPVRAVIDRAARLLDRPLSLLAPVVLHEGVAGLFCGPVHEAWSAAADLSSKRHVVWLEEPVERVLSVMPAMYDDLWVAAKGMYKMEPVVADGGEIVIYAPHVREVSHVHGKLLDEVGYHCKDYFLKQWDRFRDVPGGILAHSTHVKGLGTFDPATGRESPRIRVTLATGIPRERCERINLGWLDPASIDVEAWKKAPGTLVVPRAGELLHRIRIRPAQSPGRNA
ncbi:MAG TPA: lactate racemase domain-containing protein [Vicinamibacteria bacterium]|nr:lactate racemase domain-containing protein [Vicinamibacteria bacterium]